MIPVGTDKVPATSTGGSRFIWVLLIYFFLLPPLAVATFLLMLGIAEVGYSDLASAAVPLLLFSYFVLGAPALITAIAAAVVVRNPRVWTRLGVPTLAALIGAGVVSWLLPHRPIDPLYITALSLAAVTGSIVPGLLVELIRKQHG